MAKNASENKEEQVNNIIKSAMDRLKNLVETNTVVGSSIKLDDKNTIVPVSKINVGFIAGGGEVKCNLKKIKSENYPFAGGSGSGFNITPIGFLVLRKEKIEFVAVDKYSVFKEWGKISTAFLKKIVESDKSEVDNEKEN